MRQSLRARFERLGPVKSMNLYPDGVAVTVRIRASGAIRTIDAVHCLIRHGVSAVTAKRAVELMVEHGDAELHVPLYRYTLLSELDDAGIFCV